MITIDGHKLSEFNMIALENHDRPILPQVQSQTVSIPDVHGAYYMDSSLSPLMFNFPIGIIPQKSYQDTIYHAERFADLFVDQFGKTKEVELILDYMPNRFYKVRYSGLMPIRRLMSMAEFELPLTAYDPFSYSLEYSDQITWGSEKIKFNSTEYTLGHETLGTSTNITKPTSEYITVIGYAIKPIIEISGSANNLKLEVGEQIINFPNFNNAGWVIDCNNYTVSKDGENHYNDVKLREFWLFKGTNELKISGTNININLRVKFRDKFK